MFVVFRAWGTDFDPQKFAATFQLERCSFWVRGQPRHPGTPAPETSGFRLQLPEAEGSSGMMHSIWKFLNDGGHWLDALKAQGVQNEIDIGLLVGSDAAFTASASFDPDFLRTLADHGVGLVCSAYPASD